MINKLFIFFGTGLIVLTVPISFLYSPYGALLSGVLGIILLGFRVQENPKNPENELRPWEEHALEEVKKGNFTPYVELYFACLVKNTGRERLLYVHFKQIINAEGAELAKEFNIYCTNLVSGGILSKTRRS